MASNRLGNNGGRSYDFLFQPVKIDCSFVVDNSQATGISGLRGSGVQNVYMYSSAPSAANPLSSASLSAGVVWVQLANNYYKYAGGFSGFVSPQAGSEIAINASALSVGQPYVITTVGAGPAGAVTIAPVADIAGSLAGSYFNLYDGYGNNYLMWIYVTGVGGSAPVGVGGVPVQVTIASGATAGNITTAISAVALALADSQPAGVHLPAGVAPFTSSGAGGATLTLTSTGGLTIPGAPQPGVIAGTAWTFAQTVYNTNQKCWNGVGLPKGIVPALGASFVATATGLSVGGGSTGMVKVPGVSGISKVEMIGEANVELGPVPMGGSPNVGGWVMAQCLAASSSSVTTMIPTQPAAGSRIQLSFFVESKSVIVAGE